VIESKEVVLGGVRLRPVVGFPGYLVGEDGRVFSRMVRGPKRSGSEIGTGPLTERAPYRRPTGPGYLMVSLYPGGSQRPQGKYVHRIVLEAFVGPCPAGMEGCHNDCDPANNRLCNLRWDTRSNNIKDSWRNGRRATQRKHNGSRVLSAEQVREVRRLLAEGFSYREVTASTGLTHSLISSAVYWWKWLDKETAPATCDRPGA
jgi:hypothetical protein